MYTYEFEWRRCTVEDRIVFLEVTIDFELKKDNLKDELMDYMNNTIKDTDK